MKKFLSLVLALVMTMSLVTISAGAEDFTDAADINYEEAVAVISDTGIVNGYPNGDFKPANGLTRQAAAKIICNMILGPTTAAELNADTNPFPDVDKDSEFAGYIAYCAKEGIISGYADGTFKGANPLTGYAFAKMLLGALGYDAVVEGYTGANWSINVAKQFIGSGLNAGLKTDFNGTDYVNREEATLYAFNTLKATMVDYDQTIKYGDLFIAGSNEYDVENNARTETIEEDNKMQFAEKYFPKLTVKADTDAFERPCNTWVNGKETIGTFVDYTTKVAEYTTGVAGNEMADIIGKTALKDYEFLAYVDGESVGDDITADLTKNNKADVSYTDNGALTQVFVNNDEEEVIITVINTYLAQATMDYNAKKNMVAFDVFYGIDDDETLSETLEVSGEDFDIADVEEDDFVRVTVSFSSGDPVIESIDEVEIIADTDIQKFTAGKGGSLTVDGDKYNYNATASYDAAVLDDYTGIDEDTNLKDLTYNIYLDQYGYILGLDLVSTPDNYLFITGFDVSSSNLANKNWDANAIFMDGTSKVIEVKDADEAFEEFDEGENGGVAQVNAWFKYTVNSSDVYTLTLVEAVEICASDDEDAPSITQSYDNETEEIDAKHISLVGNDETVYGNAATIYLLADMDTVSVGGDDVDVIVGVDEVVTGVKNAAFTVGFEGDDATDLDGVYPLYKDNGYVVAAVVVGESATIASDMAYFLNDGVDSESYDKTTGLWTWTRTAIIGGEEVELKEVNDSGVSALEDATGWYWVEVKYDADGNVKDVEDADYADSMEAAVEEIVADEDLVLLDAEDEDEQKFTLKGNTLYDMTDGTKGILVDEDAKIVLYQQVKNVWETECSEGVKVLESILKNLNENVDEEGTYIYYVAAVIENGIATTVIVLDFGDDGANDGPEAGNGSNVDDITVTIGMTGVTYEVAEGAEVDAIDLAGAIKAAMNKAGYSNVLVYLGDTMAVTAEKEGISLTLDITEAVG